MGQILTIFVTVPALIELYYRFLLFRGGIYGTGLYRLSLDNVCALHLLVGGDPWQIGPFLLSVDRWTIENGEIINYFRCVRVGYFNDLGGRPGIKVRVYA